MNAGENLHRILRKSMEINGDLLSEGAGMEQVSGKEFGELQATTSYLKQSVTELKEDVGAMKTMLQNIQLTLAKADGGWRMFIALGTVCATIGGAVWEVVRHIWK